ncbi:MAG: DUF3267 domain-containing protein [Lachnospiraceae bacterium]|nr:DUF3267 domain-containing protein [Lachnospiraceae bacterium]
MGKYYEKDLPEGYKEALVIDANDKLRTRKAYIAALITVAVLFTVFFWVYVMPRLDEIHSAFSILKCVVFIIAYFVYVVLHELTHGIVYKLLTKQKLTFGFKPPAAYCGVPGIYTYRITSMASLLTPFTVYSILFIVLFFAVSDPFIKELIFVLFALHITGCIGDLYGLGLYLTRFKSPDVLRKDMGAKQIYYTKD